MATLALAAASQLNALIAYTISNKGGAAEHSYDPGMAIGETSVITFDAPSVAGITETDAGPANSVALFRGSTVNIAAAPASDITKFQALQAGGQATFDFSGFGARVFSLSVYIGSIDTYNTFELTTTAHDYFFDGTDFRANDGAQQSPETNRRVYFVFAPGETFESITMGSQGIAFEYDNFAASMSPVNYAIPVFPLGVDAYRLTPNTVGLPSSSLSSLDALSPAPEPNTWALLLSGFGIVGAVMRRRRLPATAYARFRVPRDGQLFFG